ncbi:IS21 family transposase [Patulibacter sp. NPDC049589]|uniref:IS21 family transposase n=1 Tax=Patulibacter sp. NPDC049589 TaxID=3154731 RepID=UPI003435D4B6
MEQFEQIRRDHAREGLSIRELARRHGVHRRAVRQALENALPPAKRAPEGRPAPKLGPYRPIIDRWLQDDLSAPRKQRHTARRVWQRLVAEHGAVVSERQVSRYVAARRREIGATVLGTVPLIAMPGVEAEVDWGEATVVLAGEEVVVGLFVMRACFSGAQFVVAFRRQTQQAFLEGHVRAVEFFHGVFDTVRYDNLKAAVSQVLRGRRRLESDRFVALRSHYGFDAVFCLPGVEGAHEKGGVEGEVGRFRRRHLVPVPSFSSLEALNEHLLECCFVDLERTVTGYREPVGERLWQERMVLRLSPGRWETGEPASPRVDGKGMVTVRQNRYSVPVGLIGRQVHVLVRADEIIVSHGDKVVAQHERATGRFEVRAQLDHYLELLAKKPGALARSLALHQAREDGQWPACFDDLWRQLHDRYGVSAAARQIVDTLLLVREHGPDRVQGAVQDALAAGAVDHAAVVLLCTRASAGAVPVALQIDGRLAGIGAPPPDDLARYDQLRAPAVRALAEAAR